MGKQLRLALELAQWAHAPVPSQSGHASNVTSSKRTVDVDVDVDVDLSIVRLKTLVTLGAES